MKATTQKLTDLKTQIARAEARSGLSYAEISRLSHVHSSQVSRICKGEFKTISHNVVQICITLGLELASIRTPATKVDASWSKLEASVRRIWDNTPEGANKIARMLDTIGQLRSE